MNSLCTWKEAYLDPIEIPFDPNQKGSFKEVQGST